MKAPKPEGPGLPRAPPSQCAEIHLPETGPEDVAGRIMGREAGRDSGKRVGWAGLEGMG
jgi:hypothetical protein